MMRGVLIVSILIVMAILGGPRLQAAAVLGTPHTKGDARALVIATADGPRHALVFSAGVRRPTIIVLHGKDATAAEIAARTGFVEAAASRGFTAVFPDGLDEAWHDGRFPIAEPPDDVGYLTALVARLVSDGTARPGRIYLAGISNGGMMTLTMACKAGKLFAGFATIIAAMPLPLAGCPLMPAPLIMINGSADPVMPYAGGAVGMHGNHRGSVLGVEQTTALFARADGCKGHSARALPDRVKEDGTTVTRITWSGCRAHDPVSLYRIEGGGHEVPGRPSTDTPDYGLSNLDISAADTILAAFAGG